MSRRHPDLSVAPNEGTRLAELIKVGAITWRLAGKRIEMKPG